MMDDEPGHRIFDKGFYSYGLSFVRFDPDELDGAGFAAFCSCGVGMIVGRKALSGDEEHDWGEDHPSPSHQRLTSDEYVMRFPKRARVRGVVSDG